MFCSYTWKIIIKKKPKRVQLVGLNTSDQILGGLNPSDKLCNNSHIYCIINVWSNEKRRKGWHMPSVGSNPTCCCARLWDLMLSFMWKEKRNLTCLIELLKWAVMCSNLTRDPRVWCWPHWLRQKYLSSPLNSFIPPTINLSISMSLTFVSCRCGWDRKGSHRKFSSN